MQETGRESPLRWRGWLPVLGTVLTVAVAFRLYALGRLPGINGDEAWYGVQVRRFLENAPVSWRTPTGNLPGPLHLGLLLLLQRVADASLTLLRLPSVIASLGQLVLTFFVVRRHFGASTGALALVWMAVLPVNIAYARFGWDPSHSGLVAIIAAHFALAGNPVGSALAFALALAVHPTNVFLAPFLVLALLGAEVERGGWKRALVRTGLHGVLLVVSLRVLSFTTSGGATSVVWAQVLERLGRPAEWGTFAQLYARFLSGDTVYMYIAGSGLGAARGPADVAVLALLVGLLGLGVVRLRREPVGAASGVVVGWLASLLVFFCLAGNSSIQPHLERYAMCLVVPSVLALTVLLRESGARGALMWRPYVLTTVVSVLLLGGFWLRYFRFLEETGSTSHETFWTGAQEPKEAAFARILAEAAPLGGARVVAENWWVYQPFAYLSRGGPLDVQDAGGVHGPVPPGGTYWVGFPGGPLERWLTANRVASVHWDIPGQRRPAALRVWWSPPSPVLVREPAP
ncbi:hypothetical protein [Vitiosangium sp. GDMCC 1.1324]|uniref:hypothetical protein n=1 Tax=Vitiosangium sp. (strain GDMCC 1.1324) TaxID=2138576 RepID=UPI000D38A5D6|nr:hypothetical protein [Vitiosangium sp. GDMCC 1.1324]PTL75370.1 hypothetical protein DAT35_55370 [Vitiosangium sp. GDMCC 1.1324]